MAATAFSLPVTLGCVPPCPQGYVCQPVLSPPCPVHQVPSLASHSLAMLMLVIIIIAALARKPSGANSAKGK